jgi:hypothetical protein
MGWAGRHRALFPDVDIYVGMNDKAGASGRQQKPGANVKQFKNAESFFFAEDDFFGAKKEEVTEKRRIRVDARPNPIVMEQKRRMQDLVKRAEQRRGREMAAQHPAPFLLQGKPAGGVAGGRGNLAGLVEQSSGGATGSGAQMETAGTDTSGGGKTRKGKRKRWGKTKEDD